MVNYMKLKKVCNEHEIKIQAIVNEKIVCEYICQFVKRMNDVGVSLLKTTLLSWAMIDFSPCEEIIVGTEVNDFEKKYLEENFYYSSQIYAKIYKYSVTQVEYPKIVNEAFKEQKMSDTYCLGYTEGKDSSLCKKLINSVGKDIEYYKVSYDDDIPKEDGHIYCRVIDDDLYQKYTITGKKNNSDIISFQQADDIHVTFACAYAYMKSVYPANLAVGIPWDAIHDFQDGISDLVPTETYKSLKLYEDLMRNYGFKDFKIVSPIASLHTFGVYKILEKELGLEALTKLDSCWNSYQYEGKPCGYCPKCQRLKTIFRICFSIKYIPEVIDLDIKSSDFLFGSIYATKALEMMPADLLMNSILVDEYSVDLSGQFIDVLIGRYKLNIVNTPYIEFEKDSQTWKDVLLLLIENIKIDYSQLSDNVCNKVLVPFLPFEQYYKWNRKNRVLNCYDVIKWIDGDRECTKRISAGEKVLFLPNTAIFHDYISKVSFLKEI